MSGKKSDGQPRTFPERPQPTASANVRIIRESVERVLAVDLSAVPVTRTNQFIIGWLRNVFEQSRSIAVLAEAGLLHAASPNRRSFMETVVRLQWISAVPQPERAKALDAMIDHERELTTRAFEHIREMGHNGPVDLSDLNSVDLSDMEAMVLEAAAGKVKHQARTFLAAAQSTEGRSTGLFFAWREETQYAHASAALAAAYAPDAGDKMGKGQPPVADPDLESHRHALLLSVFLATRLLLDEGVPEDSATSPTLAFLADG